MGKMRKKVAVITAIVMAVFVVQGIIVADNVSAVSKAKFNTRLICWPGASKTAALVVTNKSNKTIYIDGNAIFIKSAKVKNAYSKAVRSLKARDVMYARIGTSFPDRVQVKPRKSRTIYFKSSKAHNFTSKAGLGYTFKYRGHRYIVISGYGIYKKIVKII